MPSKARLKIFKNILLTHGHSEHIFVRAGGGMAPLASPRSASLHNNFKVLIRVEL